MQIYEMIFAMFMKFLLVITGIVAFFIILYQIITVDKELSKVIYGVLELMLAGTTYMLYKHYFPNKG